MRDEQPMVKLLPFVPSALRARPSLRQLMTEGSGRAPHTQLNALQQLCARLMENGRDGADELLQRHLLSSLLGLVSKSVCSDSGFATRACVVALECLGFVGSSATHIEALVQHKADVVFQHVIYAMLPELNPAQLIRIVYAMIRTAILLATDLQQHQARYDTLVSVLASVSVLSRRKPRISHTVSLCLVSLGPSKAPLPDVHSLLSDATGINVSNVRLLHGITYIVAHAVDFMPNGLTHGATAAGALIDCLLLRKSVPDLDACQTWFLDCLLSCLMGENKTAAPSAKADVLLATIWVLRNTANTSQSHFNLVSAHLPLVNAIAKTVYDTDDPVVSATARTLRERLASTS
jgi:hypothetical protein